MECYFTFIERVLDKKDTLDFRFISFASASFGKALEILEKESRVSTTDLQECLGVTGATVRSDLRDLEREGAIVRYHGGARISERMDRKES